MYSRKVGEVLCWKRLYLSYELIVARKVKKFPSLLTIQNIQSPPLESVCHLYLPISTHPTCNNIHVLRHMPRS